MKETEKIRYNPVWVPFIISSCIFIGRLMHDEPFLYPLLISGCCGVFILMTLLEYTRNIFYGLSLIITGLSGLYIFITVAIARLNHPEFTETQLMKNFVNILLWEDLSNE